ncbi:MAG TPA: hypothetical protein VLF39_03835 [Candidatus Saccharimonadales bacterium]|nr:hypothetical protein [Candidatus Saccharimonadales bacterium]
MESLGGLLGQQKFVEPPEIAAIKDYVQTKYKSPVSIKIGDKQITIITSSAALAGTLRLELHTLQEQLKTEKKLIIRIGS